MELTIQELLYNRGLPIEAKIKLVRHKDNRINLYELYKTNKAQFIKYQSEQSKNVFHNCQYIISFLGEEGKKARFVGVFKIESVEGEDSGPFFYNISELNGFEELIERVIIDWGQATITWHQWTNRKKNLKRIIEIQPGSFLKNKLFTDYLDFTLEFEELKNIIQNRNSYKDWFQMLSAVSGIYLILDKSTGYKYIGSAYGEEGNGIWGRWECYAKTNGHGNNKKLIELIENDNSYGKNFQFTLLMTLPKTMTPKEVIKREELYKRKLGTKSFGLTSLNS